MAQEPSTKRARTDAAAENGAVDNPYLAHLNEPAQRSSGAAMSGKAPFDGWMPRKSTGQQVEQGGHVVGLLLVDVFAGKAGLPGLSGKRALPFDFNHGQYGAIADFTGCPGRQNSETEYGWQA